MAEQMLRLVVGLVIGIWTARLLGPTDFGYLNYALAYASLFGVVATLGLNRILVRELVKEGEQLDEMRMLMSTAFVLRLGAALFLYGLAVVGAWFGGSDGLFLIAIAAGGFVFSASDCVDLYFQAQVRSRHVVQAKLMAFMVCTLVRIGLLWSKAGVLAFAAIATTELALAALALQWTYIRHGAGYRARLISRKTALRLLRESAPEIFAGLSNMMFMRLDQIMLQHLAGPDKVGSFAVASRLSELWYFIPVSIVASTFPTIVSIRQTDRAAALRRLQLLTTGLVSLSYLVVLGAVFVVAPLVPLLYGDVYAESAAILVIQIWCGVFLVLAQTSGAWIMAEHMARLNLYRSLLGLVVNIFANLLLIPRYGALGASCATLLSFVCAYFLFDFLAPPLRDIARMKLRALLILPGWRHMRQPGS